MSEQRTDNEGLTGDTNSGEHHARALRSADPAGERIRNLDLPDLTPLDSERLPESDTAIVMPGEKNIPAAEEFHQPQVKEELQKTQKTPPEAHEPGLSPFTQWLQGLSANPLPPRPEPEKLKQVTTKSVDSPSKDDTVESAVPKSSKSSNSKKPKKKKKDKKKTRKKDKKHEAGVLLSESVFSETLADLLESQGHYDQAIAMYEKLSLKYPEKSRFFAARIEKLRGLNG